jgi:hypothetical protein
MGLFSGELVVDVVDREDDDAFERSCCRSCCCRWTELSRSAMLGFGLTASTLFPFFSALSNSFNGSFPLLLRSFDLECAFPFLSFGSTSKDAGVLVGVLPLSNRFEREHRDGSNKLGWDVERLDRCQTYTTEVVARARVTKAARSTRLCSVTGWPLASSSGCDIRTECR